MMRSGCIAHPAPRKGAPYLCFSSRLYFQMSKAVLAGLAFVCAAVAAPLSASRAPATSSFPLTVDSIMRGPKLVGYPPSDLRWSGDSKELYFEWRMGDEDEAATWVVSREGGEPRRLSDEERRSAPPADAVWDRTRRRARAGRGARRT